MAACTAGPTLYATTAKQNDDNASVQIESVRATADLARMAEVKASTLHTATKEPARDVVEYGPEGQVGSISATAPGCIYLQQWPVWTDNTYWKYAQMTNYSSYSYSVRMIWSWAQDGSCVNLNPRSTWTERRGRQAHVSELRLC